MPRAIADSDDEGENVVIHLPMNGAHAPTEPQGNQRERAEGTIDAEAGTNQNSTGSTERLRKQIASAERGLVSNCASLAMTNGMGGSSSPSVQANKRRHSSTVTSQTPGSSGAEKPAKRSRTVKDYSTKHRSHLANDEHVATSQSAKFTEHSDRLSSMGLPAGSLQTGFLNHEPNVLFRESGSTIVDDSSTQLHLLEQALGTNITLASPLTKSVEADAQTASSIVFSEVSGSSKVRTSQVHQSGESEDQISQEARVDRSCKPQASPAVYICLEQDMKAMPPRTASFGTRETKKSRKRQAEDNDNIAPLESDDRPIGLPKEEYKPRLSRRRATGLVEEPIDFSVRPEKAAKVKRNRTTPASGYAAIEHDQGVLSKAGIRTANSSISTSMSDINGDRGQSAKLRKEDVNHERQPSEHASLHSEKADQDHSQKPSQHAEPTSSQIEQTSGDEIFVKPALPNTKPKSRKKTKRSHTTIFEDHVAFSGSQRAPNLSQQQASRKRRLVVLDEHEEQDELATDSNTNEHEDATPKKRGRGRPSKSLAKKQFKSAETVLDECEDESLPKSVSDVPLKESSGGCEPKENQRKDSARDEEITSTSYAFARADATSSSASVSAQKIPTPSPEIENTAPTLFKDPKSSPTTHSPFKSSSKVPLRVGLSRKSRIPSLLRVMKDPKR